MLPIHSLLPLRQLCADGLKSSPELDISGTR